MNQLGKTTRVVRMQSERGSERDVEKCPVVTGGTILKGCVRVKWTAECVCVCVSNKNLMLSMGFKHIEH